LSGRLTVTAAAVWFGYVVVQLVLSGRWWFMVVPDLAPPLVFVAVPVMLAGLAILVRRWRRQVLILACGALLVGVPRAGLDPGALTAGPGTPPPGAIRIVSWNAEYWDQGDDPARFYAYLKSFRADVYLLQEYLYDGDVPRQVDDLAALHREFPGYTVVTAGELVTLSRLPVARVTHVDATPWLPPSTRSYTPGWDTFPEFWNVKTLRTDIVAGGRTLSLYNTHVPVQLDADASPLSAEFYRQIRQRAVLRDASWRALTRDVAGNGQPLLISGDLNTTAAMGDLRRLAAVATELLPTGGSPYPVSWPAGGPSLWRLDHVFVHAGIKGDSYRLRSAEGLSDHDLQELSVSLEK
jgi:endonuclease/exonuclease/phosphatase family metal-dependent hydrolase